MKLHEAIEKVLFDKGEPMKASEIAFEINNRKLYLRNDGQPIPAVQINARVNRYKNKFLILSNLGKIDLLPQNRSDNADFVSQKKTADLSQVKIEIQRLVKRFINEMPKWNQRHSSEALNNLIIVLLHFSWSLRISERVDELNTFTNGEELRKALFSTQNKNVQIIELYEELLKRSGIQDLLSTNNVPLINFTNRLMEILENIGLIGSPTEFIDVIMDLIIDYTSTRGLHTTPSFLVELIVKLGDVTNTKSIYDPALGYGKLLLNAFIENRNIHFSGNDINKRVLTIAKLLFDLNNGNLENLQLRDSFVDSDFHQKTYDLVITDPPVGRIDRNEYPYFWFSIFSNSKRFETAFIELMIAKTTQEGRIITIVPNSFLYSKEAKSLRRRIIDHDYLESIIEIPSSLVRPNISYNCSLIVLNKNKTKLKNKVIFFDLKALMNNDKDVSLRPNSDRLV